MNPTRTRVLIVEDNADDEAMLMRQLRKADLVSHVKIFADGGAARDYLSDAQSKPEDLLAVFLDLHLPNVTGIQLLEFIRSQQRIQHLRVVVMASSIAPEAKERCRALNASFVSKPVTFDAFTRAIADTFHRHPSHEKPKS